MEAQGEVRMHRDRLGLVLVPLLALLALTPPTSAQSAGPRRLREYLGPHHGPGHRTDPQRPRPANEAADRLRYWNGIAIDASGLDHTPVAPGETRVFGEQLGPGRA